MIQCTKFKSLSKLCFPGFISLLFLAICAVNVEGQIKTYPIDTSTYGQHNMSYFFTNRPLVVNYEKGSLSFEDKSVNKTDNLYFCLFDYESDSILFKYRAENTSDYYPTQEVEKNIFYKIYHDFRIEKGIKRFSIVIPGFSHTFDSQVHEWMYRVKSSYSDTLSTRNVVLLYAWGDEWNPARYYRGKRSAKSGAADFAIFQHMLEEFLSDSAFFETHPNDLKLSLTCSSMGNQLLKKYLQEREKQDIPLRKVYNNVLFVGSDASWDSFEKGKGFDKMDQFCDTVHVFWHDKDIPLQISKYFNLLRPRMGLYGPHNAHKLPDYIKVYYVGDILTKGDIPGMGHDYLLSNSFFRNLLIKE